MPRTFTTNLDELTEQRFDKLARDAAERHGRLPSWRGRRLPDRTDALRALLTVAEQDTTVREAVIEQIRTDRVERHTATEETP